MTNEELEKAMQFILEQQAQYASQQQGIEARVSRLETSMAEMAQAQAQLARTQTQMAQTQEQLARTQAHVNEVLAATLDAHRHTEEKLEAFIGVLERYISEDRNGKSNGERAS
jgi:ABC-type transporter Mla subunit MlaD